MTNDNNVGINRSYLVIGIVLACATLFISVPHIISIFSPQQSTEGVELKIKSNEDRIISFKEMYNRDIARIDINQADTTKLLRDIQIEQGIQKGILIQQTEILKQIESKLRVN